MRYMLLMHVPHGTGEYPHEAWSREDWRATWEYLGRLNRTLRDAGELVDVQALAPPGQARVVRAGRNGRLPATDGPFPEAKEFLAGFWIVDVDSPARADEIAARASATPGPGGAPLNQPIEVRPVASARAVDL